MNAFIWLTIVVTFLGVFFARHRTLPLQLAIQSAAFAILTCFLIPLVGSTLHPVFPAADDPFATTQRIFVAIWWLLAARLIVLGGRFAYDHQERASRLVFDLVSGAINVCAILAIVNIAFGLSVTSLVATSGIIAIVLGLALQSTLGDVFSGIAISVEKPFDIGDYVWLEGGMEGSVIETNWRATRLVTDTNDIATIPNSVVAKGRILNRSRPTEIRTDTVRLVLEPSILPDRGIEIIRSSMLGVREIASASSSKIVCVDIRGEGIAYDVSFSAPRGSLSAVRSDLLNHVARNTRMAGITFAMQNGIPVSISAPDAVRLLTDTGLFSGLSAVEREALAADLIIRRGKKGETLFEQGGFKASLFMIVEGAFEVIAQEGQASKVLGTLIPGEHVGELSLLVGDASPATVKALTSFLVYEITKASLAALMHDNPNVLAAIQASGANMQRVLDLQLGSASASDVVPTHLVDRIKAFFDIPG